jgi:hypothetical protein
MTKEEILAEMDAMQAASIELSTLDNTSATSFFLQVKRLFAWMSERLFLLLETDQAKFENNLKTNRWGSLDWHKTKALEFQFGDNLSMIDGELKYATVLTGNRIVQTVTVVQDRINAGVAWYVSGYDPLTKYQLSPAQLDAMQEYADRLKIVGIPIFVRSEPGTRVKLRLRLRTNKLLLNSSGQRITNTTIYPIRDFVRNLINTHQSSQRNITKEFIRKALLTMPEVERAEVLFMTDMMVFLDDSNGEDKDTIYSQTDTYFYDEDSELIYD